MGDLTWPIIRDKVDAAVMVSESEIVDAMRMVFERMKVPALGCVQLQQS
jgi:threonine dehydratase